MEKNTKLRHRQCSPIYMADLFPWNNRMYLNYLRGLQYRVRRLYRYTQNRKLLHEISRLEAEINYLSRIVLPDQGRRNYPSPTQGGH